MISLLRGFGLLNMVDIQLTEALWKKHEKFSPSSSLLKNRLLILYNTLLVVEVTVDSRQLSNPLSIGQN